MSDPLSVKCRYCGAEILALCRTTSDEPYRRGSHAERIRDAMKLHHPHALPARAGDVEAIRRGAKCFQERMMRGDSVDLDTWRVRLACVCASRVAVERGEPVCLELLRLWPYPARLALAPPVAVRIALRPLGLVHWRHSTIHSASIAALYPDRSPIVDGEGPYMRDAVDVCVYRNVSIKPSDKALRAVVERNLSVGASA